MRRIRLSLACLCLALALDACAHPAPAIGEGDGAARRAARGELLVGNKSAASVWRLDLGDGRRLGEAATGEGPHEIVVVPGRRLAVVADYGAGPTPGHTLSVVDLDGGGTRRIDLGANTRPHGLRVLPGGRRVVATTEGSRALLVVDLDEARVEHVIDVGPGLGHMVALSADGGTAYVSKLSAGSVVRVDLAAARAGATDAVREAPAGAGAEGIAVAPDGTVWVGNRDDDTVTVHDPDSLAVLATLASPGFPIRVAFTADGRHAVVTNARAATLAIFDAATRAPVATVALAAEGLEVRETLLGTAALPIGAVADPAGGRVYVAISGVDRIAVVDTARWAVEGYWRTGREPDALAIAEAAAGP